MNRPIISVVIPVYNVEAYIERCVNSVRNQTVENIEIILIDDGSPDQSPVYVINMRKKIEECE